MTEELTIDELSEWTAEPIETLTDWRARGLIARDGDYTFADIEITRIISLTIRRGIDIEDIERAERTRPWLVRHVERLPVRPTRLYHLADIAEEIGMDLALAQRLWEAAGLADQGDLGNSMDRAMLRGANMAIGAGFPEDALLTLFRVFSDTLSRTAEAGQATVHSYVHERMKSEGATADEVYESIGRLLLSSGSTIEPTILYFYRKGVVRSGREDMVLHVAEEAGLRGVQEVPGTIYRVIAFIDLASSTPLAANKGDVGAAVVLERFSGIVRAAIPAWEGRIVKQIGDEVMLVFPAGANAVSCLAQIYDRAAAEPLFPGLRGGIHGGELLYREGDYVGNVVNTAARLVGAAERGEILVSGAVRREARAVAGVEFLRVGRRLFKGMTDEIEVFRARPNAGGESARMVDPVCGVEMLAAEAGARLTIDGAEHSFCSDQCLRTFVSNPAPYAKVASSD